VSVDISSATAKLIGPQIVQADDMVVTLGREAHVAPVPGTRPENWDTDGPPERGIDGIERMRLVCDDIAAGSVGSPNSSSPTHPRRHDEHESSTAACGSQPAQPGV
jgi:arsenate-mycothiol transferase